jgi:hypothetical protein
MRAQFGSLMATRLWPNRPPPDTLRGVDFYPPRGFIRAVAMAAQQFKDSHGYLPKLEAPQTFSEHIFWRKFFAPLPMPSLANKLAAYDYVRARLGDELLPSVVWIGDDVAELWARELTAGRFVLKANNGYNFVMFLSWPDDLDTKQDQMRRKSVTWLGSRFGYDWGEWQYCTFKPRLFLERFHDFKEKGVPDDFKIFCFRGEAQLIEVDVNRFSNRLRTAFYDPCWKHIPVVYRHAPIERERPDNLDQMIWVAETLAGDMDFARIDLYTDGKRIIKFGEITFTPGNGCSRFSDPRFDKWLGGLFEGGPHAPFSQN